MAKAKAKVKRKIKRDPAREDDFKIDEGLAELAKRLQDRPVGVPEEEFELDPEINEQAEQVSKRKVMPPLPDSQIERPENKVPTDGDLPLANIGMENVLPPAEQEIKPRKRKVRRKLR